MRSKVSLFLDLQPTFDQQRCGAPVRLAKVETFRAFANSNHSEVAVVFASEGEYNEGSFTFNRELSNKFPLQITKELCFKLNQLIFSKPVVFAQVLDEAFASDEGRTTLLELIRRATASNDIGGAKVAAPVPQPINPGPTGTALEIPNQAEA